MGFLNTISQGGGTAGGISQIASGGGNYAYGQFSGTNQANQINEQNYNLSRDKYAWDQYVQKQTWGREDTAWQRKVADLKAAGLSPILAAQGGGSESGAIVKTDAPHRDYEKTNMVEGALKLLSLMTMKADVSQTFSESSLKKAQAENVLKDTEIKDWDLEIAKKYKMPYNNPSTPGRLYRDISQTVEDKMNYLVPKASKDIDSIKGMKEAWDKKYPRK